MSNLSVTTRIIQKLSDNSGSVIPIAAKDTLSNCAITYIYDKEASKQDGKEKAIEEFGTEVLWIGGIPLLKKLFDKTVYKFFKADPNVDIRKFQQGTADSIEFALSKTKDLNQKNILQHALDNKALYKRLNIAKFITSTAATLIGLSALITYKQKTTNKALEQEYKKKMQLTSAVNKYKKDNSVFNVIDKPNDNKDVNFKGSVAKALSGFIYNPVMNMSILDAGITSTRLAQGRKGERFEIGFKEAFQILFIYCLATPIQKGLEFVSSKMFKRPIEGEYQLLTNENLKNLLKTQGLKETAQEVLDKDSKSVIEYVYNNDNVLTKLLKLSGHIPTVKGTDTIDSLAFMDSKEVKKGVEAVKKLIEGYDNPKVKVDFDKYLSQIKKIKGGAVITNILIGAFAMGVLQPVLNIILRKKKNGDSSNPAFKNIEAQMEQKFS